MHPTVYGERSQMKERRSTARDNTQTFGVRCLTTLADGTVLEGVVADSSEGGAKIAGDATGVRAGDEVELAFLFLSGEKVGYRCTIRHVDRGQGTFGVVFTSDPMPIEIHDMG